MEHLRDAVISEDGECLNIVKPTITFSVEAGPKICNEDLCPFIESYALPVKGALVTKARKMFNQKIDKVRCGVIGSLDYIYEIASEFILQHLACFTKHG